MSPTANDLRLILVEVLKGLKPMGDLSRFAIDELMPEEEGEFFKILGDL